jgi:precorrin-4/cobalt-precorrin-4 C11-methyltransferase
MVVADISPGEVLFVGAGPGDPELITLKGLKALQQAELVVYAGSLVNPALLDECASDCEIHDSAPLTLEQVLGLLIPAAQAGKRVVRLHTGEPSLYGAIQEQIEVLEREGIPCRVIPGVTLPGVSQTLVLTRLAGRTPVPESEALEKIARIGGTVCLYLSVGMMEQLVTSLLAGAVFTPHTPVAVVYRASWPDEQIVEGTLENIAARVAEAGITRQALVLVGEVLKARQQGVPEKSKLYDPDFQHGYRKQFTVEARRKSKAF